MSRRRTADGLPLEDSIPAPSTASSKARLTGVKFGRFIRARPIAAIFLFGACAAFIALALAVGYTLISPLLVHHHTDETLVDVNHEESIHEENHLVNGTGSVCVREIPGGRFGATSPTCVTAEYFMDLGIGERKIGRVTIGVFGKAVPKSALNFRALITCSKPFDNDRCYKGDSFHRVVHGFVIQGGSKATGSSIYGGTFREQVSEEHHSVLSHSETGVLAWAEYPIGSQFYIILGREAKYLDKNHVVFGYVSDGMDVVRQVENTKLDGEKPVETVSIMDCGEVKQ